MMNSKASSLFLFFLFDVPLGMSHLLSDVLGGGGGWGAWGGNDRNMEMTRRTSVPPITFPFESQKFLRPLPSTLSITRILFARPSHPLKIHVYTPPAPRILYIQTATPRPQPPSHSSTAPKNFPTPLHPPT